MNENIRTECFRIKIYTYGKRNAAPYTSIKRATVPRLSTGMYRRALVPFIAIIARRNNEHVARVRDPNLKPMPVGELGL